MHKDVFNYTQNTTVLLLCYVNWDYQVLILYCIIVSLSWLVNCNARMHSLHSYNWFVIGRNMF